MVAKARGRRRCHRSLSRERASAKYSTKTMKTLKRALLAFVLSVTVAVAESPKTENKDWEEACGGSNIAVTSVGGRILTIDAFVEHSAEGRHWQCHFSEGGIVSAVFRHFTVTRKAAGDAGEVTNELKEDRVEVFHFTDHDLSKLEAELRKDLSEIIAIARKPDGDAAPNR